MSSIPLPALHIEPPQQQNPLGVAQAIMAMRGQQQAQQMQAVQLQQAQQQLKDQQAMTAAYKSWDGKNPDDLARLVSDNGGSANARTMMEQHYLGIKKQYSDIAKNDAETGQKNLDILKQKNDTILGAINAAESVPDEQLADHLSTAVQGLTQQGMLDQQHAQVAAQLIQGMQSGQVQPAQARQALDIFKKGLQSNSQQMTQAKDEAEIKKNTAQAGEATNRATESAAQAEKINLENQQLKQYGGLTPAAADSKARFLLQRQSLGQPLSKDDASWLAAYKQQKLMVPTTVANIRSQGMGTIRQFPVYDNQTKQTVYMDSNEINDAKLREPGRFVVPQFSPEAITQQQTGKTFAPGGKGGEEALAFNTAMQHADLLLQAAKALKNGDVRGLNSVKNTLATQFGDPDITDFNAIKHVYENEVQKMIAGSHITDAEIKKNDASIPDNANFETISKVLGSYKALAQSKLNLRKQQEQLGKQGQSMTSAPTPEQQPSGGNNKHSDIGFVPEK